jgi:hypothetical protein
MRRRLDEMHDRIHRQDEQLEELTTAASELCRRLKELQRAWIDASRPPRPPSASPGHDAGQSP